MPLLALLRHAPTEWNRSGRLQGRRDLPLSAEGRALAAGWRRPAEAAPELAEACWFASPLARARETARLIGVAALPEPLLVEMDWGEWEGQHLAALRRAGGAAMAAREARGLDFSAPGGESPRQVQDRLRPFLAAAARRHAPTGAVTHKGVIRAVLALATGWDMLGPPPARLGPGTLQLFALGPAGDPAPRCLDLPLVP